MPVAQVATTAFAEAEHGVMMRCPGPAVAHELRHALVCEPAADQVPWAQVSATALADAEHCVMRRWPAPAVAHGMQGPD